jgi:imidazolonepropionase-like amidohydrolase
MRIPALSHGLVAAIAISLSTALPGTAAEGLLLTGATVHTVSGETISPGQVLIANGKILAVGKTVSGTPSETIDLKGHHLYPGLINLNTVLGLTEIEAVRATLDLAESGEFTPDVESWIAVNPDSELIPVARANGIAYFQPVPRGGTVAGQSGLVGVEGWTTEQRTLKKRVALDLVWPGMTLDTSVRERPRSGAKAKSLEEQAKERRAKLVSINDFFLEAAAYAKARKAAQNDPGIPFKKVPAWEAMVPYVEGDLPVMIHANELRQIEAAVAWAATNHLRVILAGGRDAWMVASLLASNQVPVVFDQTFSLPVRDTENYDVHFKAPELLRKGGVTVAFSMGFDLFDAPLVRNLPYAAAQAVAFGLPEDEAIKGLTLYPARMVGVADRLGSIEPGKEATLIACDGNLLDIRSNVKRLWFEGREVKLESRHTRLYEKYRSRPKS